MVDDTSSSGRPSGAATASGPTSKPGLLRSIAHRLAGDLQALPIEGRLAPFDGATGWLNSEPLTPESLRGRVVLVDFWTYTCINWLRTLPYVRAWAAKYKDAGLTVVGVHTPEFGFERDLDNIVEHSRNFGVEYPVAIDSDYGVWRAFSNHFWPAVYIADVDGRIRFHHFGEGEYAMTEMVIQQLLMDAGVEGVDQDLVDVDPVGLEVAADWRTLQSPETYVGYRQSTGFAQEDVARFDEPHAYAAPGRLPLNYWGLAGGWTVAGHAGVSNEQGGKIAFQLHARDLNLVMGPASRGSSIPFRVFLDGQPAADAHGTDVAPDGRGTVGNQRTYQLIRQSGSIADRRFEIEFLDAGVEAYCFTFG
jgi:thiol-disulfide isomerase/thioredoxin